MAKYYDLVQFLGTHFHEDWTLEYESSEDAIREFVETWPRSRVEGALADIRRFLAEKRGWVSMDDLSRLGAYIYTPAVGMTPAQWLEWAASEISARLEAADRPEPGD